jgi:lactoylglutathione lyase
MSYELAVFRVFVRDFERGVAFYRDTLGMPLDACVEAFGWAEFATGTCHLALERIPEDEDEEEGRPLTGRFLGISLRVADIHATYEMLEKRGVEFLAPPQRQAWGGTLAHFRDPERNVLTLLG